MRENELFESHLQRTNPHLLDDDEEGGGKGRKKPQKRSQQMLLTAEQKYDIAVQEMEEVREELLQKKQDAEQLMDTLRELAISSTDRCLRQVVPAVLPERVIRIDAAEDDGAMEIMQKGKMKPKPLFVTEVAFEAPLQT